jgi:hypothetical protein
VRGALEVHRLLAGSSVPHEMVHLPRRIRSADELADVLSLPVGACVSLRFFQARTARGPAGPDAVAGELVAAGVPAGTQPAMTALRAAIGPDLRPVVGAGAAAPPRHRRWRGNAATLRPAGAALVSSRTDYTALLACPVGLTPDVRLLLDTEVLNHDVLYCAAGDGATVLGIRSGDLLAATGARVVALHPEPLAALVPIG